MELHGKIIDLKPSKEDDYPAVQKILSDSKTMEHLKYMAHLNEGGWSIGQVREREQKWQEGQSRGTDLHFLAHIKSSGHLAGTCGFKHIDFTHKNAEFGLIIHHPFWGKGVATECHLLALEYAFSKLGLHRIRFETFVTNVRMRSFYENVGISLESIAKEAFFEGGQFIDNAVYVFFNRDWPGVKQRLQAKLARQCEEGT